MENEEDKTRIFNTNGLSEEQCLEQFLERVKIRALFIVIHHFFQVRIMVDCLK